MAEYIEREQVKDELLSWAVCINHPEHLLKEDALCVIDSIPAADVVEVVRCKDCIYYGDSEYCPALCLADYTNPDDFCCWAERRESDG